MKLTKEQAELAVINFVKSSLSVTKWLESYEFPDTPAESMWIWGGDRLPTEDDADRDGYVDIFNPESGDASQTEWRNSILTHHFWTPFPKHLKKPEPPDPFEVFWKKYCIDEDVCTWDEKKDHMRQAFLAGQQSQHK